MGRAVGTLAGLALGLALVAGCGSTGGGMDARSPELVNLQLSPAHAQWLVGPIARLATAEEVAAYLALDSDFAALDFIEEFWSRRDPDPGDPENPIRDAFEHRATEADRLYSEAGVLGRRTARGLILVLYGEPRQIAFDIARDGLPVETWTYGAEAAPGLDGSRPKSIFFFRQRGGVTTFFQPGASRPLGPARGSSP